MIKVEILTAYERYVIDYPQAKSLKEAYEDAFKKIYKEADIFEGPDGILDITNPADVKHIRVYDEKEKSKFPHFPEVAPPPALEKDPLDGEVIKRKGYTELLGRVVNVEYAACIDNGVPFVMVYKVDDVDAINALKKANLQKVTEQLAEANQLKGAMAIIPHAVIMEDDVEDYVKDFIADLKKATKDKLLNGQKTARAFDWGDK